MASQDDPQGFPLADGPDTAPHGKLPPKKKKKKKHKIHKPHRSSVVAGSARSEINVTPLVDVVLVLLIIFMVVTPMLHRGVHIDLPETVHHDQIQDTGDQLLVSVRADGVYIDADKVGDTPDVGEDAKPIPDAEQETMIARFKKELKDGSRPAFVRADKKLKYGQVRYVLQRLHDAGANEAKVQTEEQKP